MQERRRIAADLHPTRRGGANLNAQLSALACPAAVQGSGRSPTFFYEEVIT
jgi:hypothetical protein